MGWYRSPDGIAADPWPFGVGGSADKCLCLMDPDPAIFVIGLQDAKRKQI